MSLTRAPGTKSLIRGRTSAAVNGRKKKYSARIIGTKFVHRTETNETAMAEPINISSVPYVEELYRKFLTEPASLPDEWRQYFNQPALDNGSAAERAKPGSLQAHEQPDDGASGALSAPVLSSQLNELIHR